MHGDRQTDTAEPNKHNREQQTNTDTLTQKIREHVTEKEETEEKEEKVTEGKKGRRKRGTFSRQTRHTGKLSTTPSLSTHLSLTLAGPPLEIHCYYTVPSLPPSPALVALYLRCRQ